MEWHDMTLFYTSYTALHFTVQPNSDFESSNYDEYWLPWFS